MATEEQTVLKSTDTVQTSAAAAMEDQEIDDIKDAEVHGDGLERESTSIDGAGVASNADNNDNDKKQKSYEEEMEHLRTELRRLKSESQQRKMLHQQEARNHRFLLGQAERRFRTRLQYSSGDTMSLNSDSSHHSSSASPLHPSYCLPSPSASHNGSGGRQRKSSTSSQTPQYGQNGRARSLLSSLPALPSLSVSNHSASAAKAPASPNTSNKPSVSSKPIFASSVDTPPPHGALYGPSTLLSSSSHYIRTSLRGSRAFQDSSVQAAAATVSPASSNTVHENASPLARKLLVDHRPLSTYVAAMKASYHQESSSVADSAGTDEQRGHPARRKFMPNINTLQKQACVLQAMHWFVQIYPNQIKLLEGFVDDMSAWKRQECNHIQISSKATVLAKQIDDKVHSQIKSLQFCHDILSVQARLKDAYLSVIPPEEQKRPVTSDAPHSSLSSAAVQAESIGTAVSSSALVKQIMDIRKSFVPSFPQHFRTTVRSVHGHATSTAESPTDDGAVCQRREYRVRNDESSTWTTPAVESNAPPDRLAVMPLSSEEDEGYGYGQRPALAVAVPSDADVGTAAASDPVDGPGMDDTVMARQGYTVTPQGSSHGTSTRAAESAVPRNICDDFIVDWDNVDDDSDGDDDGNDHFDAALKVRRSRSDRVSSLDEKEIRPTQNKQASWSASTVSTATATASPTTTTSSPLLVHGIHQFDVRPLSHDDSISALSEVGYRSHGSDNNSNTSGNSAENGLRDQPIDEDYNVAKVHDMRRFGLSSFRSKGAGGGRGRPQPAKSMSWRNLADSIKAPMEQQRKKWMHHVTTSAANATASAASAFLDG